MSHESAGDTLLLEDVRSGEVVRIPAPGGILGRAGDFLARPLLAEGVRRPCRGGRRQRRALDHRAHGRNASAVERGGVWSDLRCGAPQPLFGGEMLKLADMVFRVQVGTQAAVADGAAVESDAQDAPAETAWSVRCPVCGTEYAVEGPEGRVAACTFCKDPLDARQIARVAARAMSGR